MLGVVGAGKYDFTDPGAAHFFKNIVGCNDILIEDVLPGDRELEAAAI